MAFIFKSINKGFSILEKKIAQNWFNPFATIYFNFRSLPLIQAIQLPIWLYGRPKLMNLSGKIRIDAKIKFGMIKINHINIGSPSNMGIQSEINNSGTIIFKGNAKIRTGNRIVIGYGGKLEIGKNFIMGDLINIGCFNSIRIGDNVRIAHRSQLFDSNYHYVINYNKQIVPPIIRSIEIGSNCWICNNVSISAGTKLPNNTIVSTSSLVNKDFSGLPVNSIIGGIPAKLIATGFQLVNNVIKETEINNFYHNNHDKVYNLPNIINSEEWFNN